MRRIDYFILNNGGMNKEKGSDNMRIIRTILLAVFCLCILAGCSAEKEATLAQLSDYMSSGTKNAELTIRRENGCSISISADNAEETENYPIAFPKENELASIEQMTALERVVLDFEPDELDQDLMRKIAEKFLSLPSLKCVLISGAAFDIDTLQASFPEEVHLVNCKVVNTVDLARVKDLYLTDTVWEKHSFANTESVDNLFLDLSSVPEKTDALSLFPKLSQLSLPAGIDEYTEGWPIKLTADRKEIPSGILLPFSSDDIQMYMENHPNVTVILRPAY